MRIAAGPSSNQSPQVASASRCPACARTALPSTFTRPLSGVNAQPLLGCIEQTQHPFATYHKTTFYTRDCRVLHTPIFPFTMRYWPIAKGSSRLIVTKPRRRTLNGAAQPETDLERAIRDYVRAYVWRHGRRKTAEDLGVSATPSGASSNGARWGKPCPPPS